MFNDELSYVSLKGISQSFDFVLSPDGSYTPEDPTLSTKKIYEISDGYVILNMTGIRAHVTSRLDGRGYDITRREFSPCDLIFPSVFQLSGSSGGPYWTNRLSE